MKFSVIILRREYEFQPDWHIEKLWLKVTHPLYNVKSTTEGVGISCLSAQWVATLGINFPVCEIYGQFSTGGFGLLDRAAEVQIVHKQVRFDLIVQKRVHITKGRITSNK